MDIALVYNIKCLERASNGDLLLVQEQQVVRDLKLQLSDRRWLVIQSGMFVRLISKFNAWVVLSALLMTLRLLEMLDLVLIFPPRLSLFLLT